ncbi:MAG TPA: SigE family RNA polymerase sigma factor [Frankiaceae bacterium]|nr:SigE family RNA polymerase sigma factor [Frankiaceae bacterium]
MELDELVAARGAALLRFAYLLCGDAHLAEDLVQTVLARAYTKRSRVEAADRLEPYVKRMIVNEHLTWRRRRSSGEVAVAEPADAVRPDASESVVDRDEVWRLLATLPPRQRAVLVLRYYEDLPDAAIADALGCADSAVRAYASRAMATLRIDEEARRG